MTGTLDSNQYALDKIRRYEAIYGQHFVSPGGETCARECVSRLGLSRGDAVLDVGSGLGGSAFLMAREYGARVHGIDLSENMVMLAREKCREQQLENLVRFSHGDCLELHASQDYQAVYSRDVILHIADKRLLFETLREALVPGGRLLLTDYCRGAGSASEEFESYVAERGYHLFTVEAYDEMLRESGFISVESEDWTPRFIDIHWRELQQLSAAGQATGLAADDEQELRQGWQEKITRAERGEQRWGFFTARRA